MDNIIIRKVREHPDMADAAARWFHEKWGIPLEAYQESVGECLKKQSAVPQWYLAMDGEDIAGGLGVIENDYHNRKDLTPNVCAVYVEEIGEDNWEFLPASYRFGGAAEGTWI